MDRIVDAVPGLPALDVLVPQMVDRLLVLLAAFDVLVPEQVIKVPKMLTPTRCPRTVLSVPQTAEQLVEAPNVVSLIDVIRHPVDQTVGGGRIGAIPGFLPGQSYSFLRSRSLTIQFLVSVVVLVEVLMVYTQDRVLQRFVEQIIVSLQRLPSRTLTFQLRVVRLEIFINILFLQLVLQICWKQQNQGFFPHFSPPGKKCEDPAHPGVGTGCGLQLMASVRLAGVSSVAQHGVRLLLFVAERQEWCSLVCSSGLPSYTVGSEQPLVQAVHGCCLSVLEASGRITCSACCVSRCLHFALVSFSPFRCLGVACGVRRNRDACAAWFDSGFFFYGRLRTNFSIFHGAVNSNPEAVLLHPVSVEKCAQSMLLVAVSLSRGSHVGIWTLFLRVLHVLAVAAVFCCPVQLGPSMMREFCVIEGSV